jgi:triacylglycerol lipase
MGRMGMMCRKGRAALSAGFLAFMLASGFAAGDGFGREKETVVLLHGMGRSRVSIWVLEHRLGKAGYETLNFPYSATFESFDDITAKLHKFICEKVKTRRYHLVGHSLGNLIIRNGFKQGYKPDLARIVMLAPPNQPAKLAQDLKDLAPFRWLTGDAGEKLASEEFYRGLPAPNVEFAVIAGDSGQRFTFDEPNDGVVTVESTKLAGVKDWIALHHTHTLIMNAADTAECVVSFLQNGRLRDK